MLVFYGHIAGGLGLHLYAARPTFAETAARVADLGAFGVEIFFVISGYVISGSVIRYSAREFAERRLWRLYPTFLFFTLLFFVSNRMLGLVPELDQAHYLVLNLLFLDHLAGTPSLTPNAWSITFEVWYYVIACLAFFVESRVAKTRFRWPARTVCGLAIGAYVVWQPISLYFLGGVLVFALRHQERWPIHTTAFRLTEAINLACWLSLWIGVVDDAADLRSPVFYARVVATVLAFALLLDPRSLFRSMLESRPLAFLGTVSYSLYLLHPYTVRVVREIALRLELDTTAPIVLVPLFYLAATVVTLATTALVHRAIELAPYRWRFHAQIYRREAEAVEASSVAPSP